MTRSQALAEGRSTYEGRPCKRCGGTKRYTSNFHCIRATYIGHTPEWDENRRSYIRKAQQNSYWKRRAEGRCGRCGGSEPIGAICMGCLNQMENARLGGVPSGVRGKLRPLD